MQKILFHTLGCKLNQAETAQIGSIFRTEGIVEVNHERIAKPHIVFINTCAVTERASAKSRHAISHLIRKYPDAIIIAAGCMAQHEPDKVATIQGVDYVLGTDDRFKIHWWQGKPSRPIIEVSSDPAAIQIRSVFNTLQRSRPFLKIQDGCDHRCTYCIIPRLRGNSRSVSVLDVIASAKRLIDLGAEEIVLTGVRIGSYGKDLPEECSLFDITQMLSELPGIRRIRLGSIEPWELEERLIELVANDPKICPHLHIPLQHTHRTILKLMERPPLGDVIEFMQKAKYINPNLAIGVDIIVGFPGETDSEFKCLMKDLTRLPLTYIHSFSFSARSGTVAAKLGDRVHTKVVKRRVATVIELAQKKKHDFAVSQAGRYCEAIPDRIKPGTHWVNAVTENYLKIQLPVSIAHPGHIIPVVLSIEENGALRGEQIQ